MRTTAQDVAKLIVVDTASVDAHIETANLIVTEKLADKGMSSARLKIIETYLAAHLVAIAEEKGGLTSTSMGESSDSFANVYSEGFKSTRFGQLAISFDESGTLAKTGSKGKALFRVV